MYPPTHESGEDKQYDVENCSKLRRISSQCFAASAANTVMFTIGNFFGFMTILLAELYRDDAEITMSQGELSLFSSNLFLTPIGAIMTGVLAQNYGSKKSMLIASSMFGITWVIFYFARNVTMLLVASSVLAMSFVAGPTVTYVAEISEPNLRGVILSTTTFSMTLGSFITVLMGVFLYWRTIALINLTITAIGFVTICFIPDSPLWLASKRRFYEAERSLAWLRGWTILKDVNVELQTIKEGCFAQVSKSDSSACNQSSEMRNRIKLFQDRSLYIPLASVTYMFMMRNLSGCLLIKIFAGVIFKILEAPSTKYLTAMIFGLRISGALTYICCVKSFGKRRLACLTLVITGIFLLVAVVAITFRQSYHDDPDVCMGIAVVSILCSNFVSCAGYDSIVNDLNGELFPSKFRNFGAGIGNFFNSIFMALMNLMFLYIIDLINIQGTLIMFTISCFIGSITFYFIIPVIEGKSLIEIESHYSKNSRSQDSRTDDSQNVTRY